MTVIHRLLATSGGPVANGADCKCNVLLQPEITVLTITAMFHRKVVTSGNAGLAYCPSYFV